MVKSRFLKKNLSNYFIFNLSVTELLFLLVGTPLITTFTASKDPNPIQCKIEFFLSRTCAAAIFVLLSGIALDRYFNIAHPLKTFVSHINRWHASLAVWIYAAICGAPFLYSAENIKLETCKYKTVMKNLSVPVQANLNRNVVLRKSGSYFLQNKLGNISFSVQIKELPVHNTLNEPEPRYTCGISTGKAGKSTFFIYFIFAFFIPLVVMVTTYSLTTLKLWKRSKTGRVNRVFAKSKVKSMRMLVFSVMAFSVSWGAVFIRDMLNAFNVIETSSLNKTGVIIVSLMGYLYYFSPIMNAALYSLYNANFRKEMKNSYLRVKRMTLQTVEERISSRFRSQPLKLQNLSRWKCTKV